MTPRSDRTIKALTEQLKDDATVINVLRSYTIRHLEDAGQTDQATTVRRWCADWFDRTQKRAEKLKEEAGT